MRRDPNFGGDEHEIQRAVSLLYSDDETREMRAPDTHRGVVSGYFQDREALVRHACMWSGKAESIYLTLNPVRPDLRARANNRCREYVKSGRTTTDAQIIRRRWLLLDFDAIRPAGISSTDAEHGAAIERAQACRAFLTGECGWPEPILADSGNGGHLLYRIDLPNDKASERALKSCLAALAHRFDDEVVAVDPTTFNASRLGKLYGTLAMKGDNVPELGRVHRMARLLEVPDPILTVDLGDLGDE